jgi:hypothetical protein
MGITLTMKLLTHESKFFKKIDTLCDPNFSIFQFLISLFCEIFPINKRAGVDHSGSPGV